MPEHRVETPSRLRDLESFLWHDFAAGLADWTAWVRRKMPHIPHSATKAAFEYSMQLHVALRALQAANSGIRIGDKAAGRGALNGLIARYLIQPRLNEDGQVSLAADGPQDPVVLLVLMALDAMQCDVWRRFKLCRETTCRASYYDASKAAAKTWCSMETCGSRNKMRRYRARA
jgi:predicted RNA-binding Zn ribbon-like protein